MNKLILLLTLSTCLYSYLDYIKVPEIKYVYVESLPIIECPINKLDQLCKMRGEK